MLFLEIILITLAQGIIKTKMKKLNSLLFITAEEKILQL